MDCFETADYKLVSFLSCRGINHLDLKRTPSGKVIFQFSITPELRSGIDDWKSNAQVPVRLFCDALEDTRTIIFRDR